MVGIVKVVRLINVNNMLIFGIFFIFLVLIRYKLWKKNYVELIKSVNDV